MLQSNQTLPDGWDLAGLFKQMLGELPWPTLVTFIRSNSQIHKICTMGGYRLDPRDPKPKARMEGIVLREMQRAEFSQASCNGIFAFWYPIHAELHEALEGHFHSDAYKAWRQEQGLAEDVYSLTDEKFNEFFKPQDLAVWKILLCFSPLQLSDAQIVRIVETKPEEAPAASQASVELTTKLALLETELARAKELRTRFEKEAQAAQAETREVRKTLRTAEEAVAAQQARSSSLAAESTSLRQKLAETEARMAAAATQRDAEVVRARNASVADLEKLKAEAEEWKRRYESRCLSDREGERALKLAQDRAADWQAKAEILQVEIGRMHNFADLLLKRFNWADVGQQMKLTPNIKRQFTSLLKKLNYEENTGLVLEGTLTTFWNGLLAKEQKLIAAIAESDVREIADGSAKDYWEKLSEDFEDAAICLEARLMLLKLLEEIFYSSINDEALAAASVYETVLKEKK